MTHNNEQNNEQNELEHQNFGVLPVGQNEDVEFAEELADDADNQALKRAAEADQRAQQQTQE